jgi:uncharacterized membrane protein
MIIGALILSLTILLMGVLLDVLGRRVRHGVYFGVTTGAGFAVSDTGRRLARRYRLWVWGGTLISLALLLALMDMQRFAGLTVFVQIVGMTIGWVQNWREAKAYAIAPDTRRVAALSPSNPLPAWVIAGVALSFAALAGVAIALMLNYDRLPDRFPTHYGPSGRADAFGTKSASVVFAPVLIGTLVLLLIYANLYGLAFRMRRGGSPDTYESRLSRRDIGIRMLGILGMLIGCMMAFISAAPLFGSNGLPGGPWVMLAFVGGILITAFGSIWRWSEVAAGAGDDTPDDRWKGGMFYYNADDPAWVVERRDSAGYTVNFAQPLGWVVLAAIAGVLGSTAWLITGAA